MSNSSNKDNLLTSGGIPDKAEAGRALELIQNIDMPEVKAITNNIKNVIESMIGKISSDEPKIEPPLQTLIQADQAQSQSNLNIIAESLLANVQLQPKTTKAEEIFSCKNVQIYFIDPNNKVATRSSSVALRIISIPHDEQDLVSDNPRPPAFLEAGDWVYPLIPSQSPVYRSSEGYFIFPDLLSDSTDAFVGLTLPSSLATDDRDTFEMMLLNLMNKEAFPSPSSSDFTNTGELINSAQSNKIPTSRERGKKSEPTLGPQSSQLCTKIAVGMMAVAEGTSRGLSMGAEKTVELIDKGADFVKNQLPRATEPKHIDSDIKNVVTSMNKYSGHAVELSGFLISKLGEATSALASFVAYHCQSTATELVVKYGGLNEGSTKDCIDNMLEISGGAMNSIKTVYVGLRGAARTLANSITTNTVDIVEHCYGQDAGEIVEMAAGTVGNVTTLGLNVGSVNPQKVLARAAKETGRGMLVKAPDSPELNLPGLTVQSKQANSGTLATFPCFSKFQMLFKRTRILVNKHTPLTL